ncbi:DUF3575 domain-containing protein [Mesonia ostreae]|uniref:DUF3575 domain-containing protein n=1 Tax=Mesonia ostreae TaxID=861110 RepID=A0ABU2KKG1_9FLAO|nr:DUF3575 domain-containing protein [Mesonia ostreae]MDT0295195.1 DUF3575 domain-containing protein [Mesonia ostreae]
MKKILFFAFILFSANTITAQDDSIVNSLDKKNEIKLNAVMLLVGAFEMSYERNLNDDSSAGISAFVPFDDEVFEDYNYSISPYYRIYFSRKYAAGFFVEGFTMLNSIDHQKIWIYDNNGNLLEKKTDTYVDLALGFGIGGKWVTKRGIVFELVGGIGRNLLHADEFGTTIVGKFGFNLGYRF